MSKDSGKMNREGLVENECLSFLSMLRYKDIPIQEENIQPWINRLCSGDKDIIYPILHWCFSNHANLKKRAYLAQFLTPIDLPLEVTMTSEGENIMKISEQYQKLQTEFKEVHKIFELVKREETKGNIKGAVRDLQEEKCQLLERINDHKDKKSDDDSFPKFLELISTLRKEQDNEMRLNERLVDQKRALALGEMRLKQLQRRQKTLRSMTNSVGGASINIAMGEYEEELTEMTMMVRSDLISERNILKRKIEELEKDKLEPTCTEDDLEEVQFMRKELEDKEKLKKEQMKKEQLKSSNSKVTIFKQVRTLFNHAYIIQDYRQSSQVCFSLSYQLNVACSRSWIETKSQRIGT